MFGQNSILNTSDFDKVLQILELVSDKGKTKDAVHRTRQLAECFEKLASDQAALAKEREAHAKSAAKLDKELADRETDVACRENALKAAEERVSNLENDLHRRLALLKSAAA